MGWLVVATLLLLWLLLLAVLHLHSRYRYGPRSRAALAAEGAGGLVLAYWAMRRLFPGLSPWAAAVLAPLAAAPVFLAAAVATVELWRWAKQAAFEREIARLEAEERRLSGSSEGASGRQRRPQGAGRTAAGPGVADSTRFLEEWQRRDGLARVRAVRLREWEEELERLSPEELRRRLAGIEAALRGRLPAEEDDALRARWHATRLALLRRSAGEAGGAEAEEMPSSPHQGPGAAGDRPARRELDQVREELARQRALREEFLSGRTALD